MKTALIILAVLIVLFVPFYPFRLVKRIVFYLLNTFIPLIPIKFDDIGGVPLIGIRLFNVRIALGGRNTLEAREMRIRINLWRVLWFRRPSVDPVSFFDPIIHLHREKERDEIWFLFPLNMARRVVGFLFANIWGTNTVKIQNGTLVMHGGKGDTTISQMNGTFLSLGTQSTVRYLDCRIGHGRIILEPSSPDVESDIRLKAVNLPLDNLIALKVPQHLTGDVQIDAIMRGGFGPPVIDGDLKSACIYMRQQPIRNLHSPLHFEGETLELTSMRGDVGDYLLTGLLETNVVTDIVRLKLHGVGTGTGPGLIFGMLNMQPYINSAEFDGRIDLKGDFEVFGDITGDIDIKLRDVRLNPQAFSQKAKPEAALPRIPVLNFDFFMQEGSLYLESIEAFLPGSRIKLGGRIDMTLDEEIEKVTDTYYDLAATIKNDTSLRGYSDRRRYLSIPLEFDGKMRLSTHQTEDSKDFHASGNMELKDFSVQTELFKFLGRLREYVDISFRNIAGDVEFTAQHIAVRDLEVDAYWMKLLANGRIGFDGALDLVARTRMLSREETDESSPLLRFFPDLAHRLKADFRITGTAARPRVRLLKPGSGEHVDSE